MFVRWQDGTQRVAPKVEQRLQLIQQMDKELRRFQVQHIYSILRDQ